MGFTLNQHEQEKQIKKLQKKKDQDTTNYNDLSNLPQINGVELKGDKSLSDLGIQAELTLDDTPTNGSNNPVKSDGVYDADNSIYEVMGQMGAKNLHDISRQIPRSNVGTTSVYNADGTVTINGTASAAGAQLKAISNGFSIDNLKVGDTLIFSYEVISGSAESLISGNNNTSIYLYRTPENLPIALPDTLSAGDKDFKLIEITNDLLSNGSLVYNGMQIWMQSGAKFNNLKLAIMLRLGSDTSDEFRPYAKTNKQLTDDITGITPHILPDTPTTDGSYNLKVTVTSGEAAYSWEAVTP